MCDQIDGLREQASRARRLSKGVTDPATLRQLADYADECEQAADRLEAPGEKTAAGERDPG